MKLSNASQTTHQFIRNQFTREQLRTLARIHNVPRGRNKMDTIANLLKADKLSVNITVIPDPEAVKASLQAPDQIASWLLNALALPQ